MLNNKFTPHQNTADAGRDKQKSPKQKNISNSRRQKIFGAGQAISMSVLAALLIFNQFQILSLHNMMMSQNDNTEVAGAQQVNNTANTPTKPNIDLSAIAKQILPTGIPAAYGAELGVSFDDAAASIAKLAPYEQDTRTNKLTGEKLARYIKIGQQTACEFCCGARTLVFDDGRKACGCAHSTAMRGVVAYLLDNYGDTMTDQQILAEANKLKAVYFPGPTVQKYAAANGLLGKPAQGLQQQVGGC